jgi:sec-independent protein translocase protein TatC
METVTSKNPELEQKDSAEDGGVYMSLGDHIDEFRKRLTFAILGIVLTVTVSLFFTSSFISYIRQPYISIMLSQGMDPKMQSISPTEGFATYIKVCMILGLTIAAPWVFYQIWKFVSVGLYPSERKLVNIAIPLAACLFMSGVLFFAIFIAPLTLKFFIVFNKTVLGVESIFTFEKYISFLTTMTLIFGLSFQTPIVVFVINKLGIISIETLANSRKYVVLVVVILAAVLTPGPDVISQISLAIPLYFLFELGIFLSRLSNKKAQADIDQQQLADQPL